MADKFEVKIEQRLNLNPLLKHQLGEKIVQSFIDEYRPKHEEDVIRFLKQNPDIVNFPIEMGYIPSKSNRYKIGKLEVAFLTQMMHRREGVTYWRTSLTTADDLDEWLKGEDHIQ